MVFKPALGWDHVRVTLYNTRPPHQEISTLVDSIYTALSQTWSDENIADAIN